MDLYTVIKLLILSLIAGLATFIGVFIGSYRDFGKRGLVFGTSFAAGIMILISAFELIPGSVKASNLMNALIFLVAGFVVVWLMNLVIPHLHSVKNLEDCDDKYLMKMSYLLAFGLILHDFPEGFAIASSYAYSASLGLLVVLACLSIIFLRDTLFPLPPQDSEIKNLITNQLFFPRFPRHLALYLVLF